MQVFGVIYIATNIINRKSYIGKTTKGLSRRRTEHYSFDKPITYFQKAIKKYGKDSFKWEVLKECFSGTELSESEIFYIDLFKTSNPTIGYNMTKGGDGFAYGDLNPVHRPDVKAKIIVKLKLNNGSFRQDVRDKISKTLTGRKLTVEHRNAISNGNKGRNVNKGKDNPISKKWIVIFPNGHEIEIKGLREFCRIHNLNPKLMRRTSKDLTKIHKGFRLQELNE